jgi:hypothetical protein
VDGAAQTVHGYGVQARLSRAAPLLEGGAQGRHRLHPCGARTSRPAWRMGSGSPGVGACYWRGPGPGYASSRRQHKGEVGPRGSVRYPGTGAHATRGNSRAAGPRLAGTEPGQQPEGGARGAHNVDLRRQDKTALVTRGSAGIGTGIARGLLSSTKAWNSSTTTAAWSVDRGSPRFCQVVAPRFQLMT